MRGLLAAVTLAWIITLLVTRGGQTGDPIRDASFIRAAERVCAGSGSKIRATPPPSPGASFEVRAKDIERVARELDEMARGLRALSVDAADVEVVDRWLDQLERFNAIGYRYATAIRAGDLTGAERIGTEGATPSARFNATSRRNDIDNCVLG